MVQSKKNIRVLALVGAVLLLWVNNSSVFIELPKGTPLIVAHRGLHQEFDRTNLTRDDCTATRIYKPRHDFLENTIPSIRASFDMGTDGVEIDIHPTNDGKFVVFHDWRLECRTDGQGVTRQQSMAYLQKLDIGYGYTYDSGKSYPFRGTAIGAMPELSHVLQNFPEKTFFINFKGKRSEEADQLLAYLQANNIPLSSHLIFYGADTILSRLKQLAPAVQTFSKSAIKECLLKYTAVGWTGYMPEACQNQTIAVPINYAGFLWGWPRKFISRMDAVKSTILIFGPLSPTSEIRGINSAREAAAIPASFNGIIWVQSLDAVVEELTK
ncbi:MAG: hypothetical protein JKY60_18850 [Kordiimonadaceae bacterium]|nr:hypothetical protein [Kordiimonadaceae bacterium]